MNTLQTPEAVHIQHLFVPPTPYTDKVAGLAADFKAADREEYESLLKGFDWQYEFSDDGMVRRKARMKLARILELQPTVDPDKALLKAACPGRHGDALCEVA